MATERKRIAIEVPVHIHKEIAKRCEETGLHMTQWVIMLILEALKEK